MTQRKPKRAAGLGVTDDEYQRLLAEQGGGCAICEGKPKRLKKDGTPYRLHVDHDHATGRIRGLLCYRCNKFLASYNATRPLLLRAVRYLDPERDAATNPHIDYLRSAKFARVPGGLP